MAKKEPPEKRATMKGLQDERTKIEKETKQNHQTVEPSSRYEKEHRSQITKNQILKTKTNRDYRRQVNERKTTSKTTEL